MYIHMAITYKYVHVWMNYVLCTEVYYVWISKYDCIRLWCVIIIIVSQVFTFCVIAMQGNFELIKFSTITDLKINDCNNATLTATKELYDWANGTDRYFLITTTFFPQNKKSTI